MQQSSQVLINSSIQSAGIQGSELPIANERRHVASRFGWWQEVEYGYCPNVDKQTIKAPSHPVRHRERPEGVRRSRQVMFQRPPEKLGTQS